MKSAWNQKGTRVLLAVAVMLLAANLVFSAMTAAPRAAVAAGLPDTAAQMERMIDELARLNKSVEKMQGYLESGKMTVKVEKTEK